MAKSWAQCFSLVTFSNDTHQGFQVCTHLGPWVTNPEEAKPVIWSLLESPKSFEIVTFFTYGTEEIKFEAITLRDTGIDKVLGLQSVVFPSVDGLPAPQGGFGFFLLLFDP